MPPKATLLSACGGIGVAKQSTVGFAINFIPLILTFSRPGEGTVVRYVTVIVKRGT